MDAHSIHWPESDGSREPEVVVEVEVESNPPPATEPETGLEVEERLTRRFEHELKHERHKAHQEGLETGSRQATEDYRLALLNATRCAADIAALKPKLRKEAEQDLVQLALAIARRIIRRELTVDPHALCGIVRAALEQLKSSEVHRLRLHPADHPIVAAMEGRFTLPALQPDASLARGTLLFDTAKGGLDASIETQFAEIEKGLFDRLGNS